MTAQHPLNTRNPRSFHPRLLARVAAACALACPLVPGIASAQVSGSWTTAGNGAWNVAGNWSGGIPNGGGTATFSGVVGAPSYVVTLPALPASANFTPTLSRITFDLNPGEFVRISNATSGTTATQRNTNQGRITVPAGGLTLDVIDTDATPDIRAFLTGTGAVTKIGLGSLTLSTTTSSSNFSGGLNVNAGTLSVNPNTLGSGPITVAPGAKLQLTTGGTSLRTTAFTVNGTFENAGGGLRLQSNAAFNGPVTINVGNIQIASNNVAFNNPTFVINNEATLTIVPPSPLTLSTPVNFTGTGTVTFGGTIALAGATVTTGTLQLNSGTTVLDQGDIGPATALSFRGVADVELTRADTYTLPNNVYGNTFYTDANGDPARGPGRISTAAGSVTTLSGDFRFGGTLAAQGDVIVAPASGLASVASVGAFELSPGSFVDLRNNDLVVHAQSEAAIRDLVKAFLTTGGTEGLGSSLAGQTSTGDARDAFATLAVFDNLAGTIETTEGNLFVPYFQTLGGIDLVGLEVLVKYTYFGDTDLDGDVDGSDLANLIEGFSNGYTGWRNGDFNYDDVINQADFALFNAALAGQGAPLASPIGPGGVIPEPGTLGLLAAAALGLASRPRRERRV